jgi:hypothetical protein
MEHAEKIETAFVNYLTAQTSFSSGLLIYPGENNLDKTGSRIVAYVGNDLGNEEPPLSGNRTTAVTVELRTPYTKLTAAEAAAGTSQSLTEHKANAGALETALFSATLPEDLTAATTGFTCFGIADRQPERAQDGNFWQSAYKITIYSCASAFSN